MVGKSAPPSGGQATLAHRRTAVMLERQPEIIDGVEDLVYVGLLLAAALLLYEVLGFELQR